MSKDYKEEYTKKTGSFIPKYKDVLGVNFYGEIYSDWLEQRLERAESRNEIFSPKADEIKRLEAENAQFKTEKQDISKVSELIIPTPLEEMFLNKEDQIKQLQSENKRLKTKIIDLEQESKSLGTDLKTRTRKEIFKEEPKNNLNECGLYFSCFTNNCKEICGFDGWSMMKEQGLTNE